MDISEKIKKGLECRIRLTERLCDGLCSKCQFSVPELSCKEIYCVVLNYIQQLEHENKDLLEERELNEHLRDKVQQLEAQVPKWISVEERLPENEKPVLIATKWSLMGMHGMAVSCGFYTNGKTFTGDSDYDWNSGNVDLDYDEEEDEYIVPEGWWESVRYTEQFSAVDEPVAYWMPPPEGPKEG